MRTFVCLLLLGCTHHQVLGEGVNSAAGAQPLAVHSGCSDAETDHISVDGAELTGSQIRLRLRHGGGCESHSYRLCPDPVVLRTEPGIQRLVVVHEANGDMCEAEFEITAAVDLADLPHSVLSLESLERNVVHVSVD